MGNCSVAMLCCSAKAQPPQPGLSATTACKMHERAWRQVHSRVSFKVRRRDAVPLRRRPEAAAGIVRHHHLKIAWARVT